MPSPIEELAAAAVVLVDNENSTIQQQESLEIDWARQLTPY